MSDAPDTKENLEQTAIMLEQILGVMPEDLFTLRALYETSLKLEQPEKAFSALTKLDDLSRSTQNAEMIDFVLNQYASIAGDSSDVQGRISRLEEMKEMVGLLNTDKVPDARPKQEGAAVAGEGGRLDAEMALAWALFQDEQLTQEEYSNILHDLTEMSSREMGVPVTVLHILHDRQFSRFERLMTHLCQKYEVPIMTLSQFEDNEEISQQLPFDFTSHNGVIPFAKVGNDLLVGILNPLDKELLQEAETLSGLRCHSYLVTPEEYDQQLGKAKLAQA